MNDNINYTVMNDEHTSISNPIIAFKNDVDETNITEDISFISNTMNIDNEKKSLEKYEMVQHPSHYNLYNTEAVDMIYKIYGDKCGGEFMPLFCEATALLYRLRMGLKPDNDVKQELNKERWWLNKRDEYKK